MTGLVVTRLVGGYDRRTEVLHGVDLNVDPGTVSVLLGSNGAGKTTTLRAISGLLKIQGEILFDGKSLVGLPAEEVVRHGVAHVPQGRGTFNELTVDENLRIGGYGRRASDLRSDTDTWYDRFPRLADRRRQLAGMLSGGEQQMLAVARAMMSRPRLLLLDEPSLGLAPLATQSLFHVLDDIVRTGEMSMLLVEQNANLAIDLATSVFVMESGCIVSHGSAEEIKSDGAIQRAYLGS